MAQRLLAVMERLGGVASRPMLIAYGVTAGEIDSAVRRREMVAVFPSTYTWAWLADHTDALERAAVMRPHRGPRGLSHLSALRRWDLPGWQPPHPVHVVIPYAVALAPVAGMVAHRARVMPPLLPRGGVPTIGVGPAVVTSWPLLAADERRAPAIDAVRRRLVKPSELRADVAAAPRLPGRAALLELVGLLEAGCESELEIWGHRQVFDVPGLRHAVQQKVVAVAGRRFRLDRAYEEEMVAVEMDGRRYHEPWPQRESDTRRDALLASVGWLTLRFSGFRLHHDVAGCRRDTLATLAARRSRPRH